MAIGPTEKQTEVVTKEVDVVGWDHMSSLQTNGLATVAPVSWAWPKVPFFSPTRVG
uniref:Uncharacterized protein n=1 Tax=Oryza sativa subsp. japonica TaxID=39947 RepID=Q6ERH6_ORYSJ|nr:hypothetical protein [Oryza sativa Japonica Group]